MGSLVGLDLVLLFCAWQTVLLALVLLVGGWGGRRGPLAAAKLAAYGLIGSAALLLAFIALARASGRTFLVDGASVGHPMAVPGPGRTSFPAEGAVLGVAFV